MGYRPVPESPTERSLVIPPPVMGWNTKDPKSAMDPQYALELVNFFPGNGIVSLRNGYSQHVLTTTVGGYTHLAEYVNSAGTHFLIGFAVTGSLGVPYNVTSAGAGTAITGGFVTGSAVNYTVNFRGRLYCKGYSNSFDILSTDGTAATLAAFTGPSGDDKDLWRLAVYKNRLYALAISNASMWYGGVQAITGAMTEFDFSSVLTLGGQPWYIGSFAMTAGDISQAYFIVISEQGEVLLYQGDYPGSSTWQQIGQYFIAAPVGRNSFFNWGSDLLVITNEGLVSIRDVVGAGRSEYTYLSDNISSEFRAAVSGIYPGYDDYIQGVVYPKGQYLLLNFYAAIPDDTIQFVMNTQTRAWCKFQGQRAIGWSLLNDSLYFGNQNDLAYGYIAKADSGYRDEDINTSSQTKTRTIKCRHAFNYFGDPTKRKHFVAAIPTTYQSEGLSITANVDVDYTDETATSTETDTSKGTSFQIYQPRLALSASSGNAASFRIDGTVTTKRFTLEATKVIWNEGGIE